MTPTPRRLIASALLVALATGLGGCLVKKEKPSELKPLYNRKSEALRIYQDGDQIRYTVQAQLAGTQGFQTGSLLIRWKRVTPDLIGPDGTPYQVMKKHYQLCWDDPNGFPCDPNSDPDQEIVQYVEQDPAGNNPDTQGTERFVAMDTATPNQYYWVNNKGSSTEGGDGLPKPAAILKSPLQTDSYPTNFFVVDDCSAGSCQSNVAQVERDLTVSDDNTLLTTNIERFANPFHIEYNGIVTPWNTDPLPMGPLDLFSICSSSNSRHSGDMYVVPEIGMVRLVNICTDTTNPVQNTYTFSIFSVSFDY